MTYLQHSLQNEIESFIKLMDLNNSKYEAMSKDEIPSDNIGEGDDLLKDRLILCASDPSKYKETTEFVMSFMLDCIMNRKKNRSGKICLVGYTQRKTQEFFDIMGRLVRKNKGKGKVNMKRMTKKEIEFEDGTQIIQKNAKPDKTAWGINAKFVFVDDYDKLDHHRVSEAGITASVICSGYLFCIAKKNVGKIDYTKLEYKFAHIVDVDKL